MTGCSTAAGADVIRDGKIDFVRFVIWCTLLWATDSFIIMSMSEQQHILTASQDGTSWPRRIRPDSKRNEGFFNRWAELSSSCSCIRTNVSSSEVIFWLATSQNSRLQLPPAGHLPLKQSVTESSFCYAACMKFHLHIPVDVLASARRLPAAQATPYITWNGSLVFYRFIISSTDFRSNYSIIPP